LLTALPLLGVDRDGLARRDPEEGGVELVDLVEEGTPSHALPGAGGDVQVPAGHQLSAMVGNVGYGMVPVAEQPPERSRVRRLRQAAGEPDHRYRVASWWTCPQRPGPMDVDVGPNHDRVKPPLAIVNRCPTTRC